MDQPFHRLQIARQQAGFESATEAARAFGWNENTYRSHENGERGLRIAIAERYAKAFDVSAAWLLTGENEEDRQAPEKEPKYTVRLVGRIGAGAVIDSEFEQEPPGGFDEVQIPYPAPSGAVAFEIVGDSMWPRYDPGDIVICWKVAQTRTEADGWEAAVRLTDGRRYLKTIRRVSKDRFDLISHNASPIHNVQIEWACKVFGNIRAGEWMLLERKPSKPFRRLER
ncbi:XRE family transcriptional regulator [Beijerinckia indica]|uniref:Putative phage repressor n=1 Tax=Beijerinckia indica subsp. indica (strain ATCC 9039 / DSM 1715 / NCIMB 8712) TaxID=395963 RepID=B2IKA6_BEII9|nr:XRE family transcriptional regulator [Beijerinckia indica]ACB95038.1 putative phage repressor [Beijerinckia indica subsp. indica ATCC 9039]